MSPVLSGPPHDCAKDGHMIALRLRWDIDTVRITPFCDLCRLVMLPSASMTGSQADWLMGLVESARFAPEAPPEAYEGMFA
jgi:hypothetical protein